MKSLPRVVLAGLFLLTFSLPFSTAHAQGTVFTYQGRVQDNGTNFTGTGQFEFALVTATNINVQARATANLTGTFVTSYSLATGGSGYVTVPAVHITGGGGSNATATASISGGVVTSVTPGSAGTGYSSPPTVTIDPPPANLAYTTYWSNDGTSVNGSQPSAAVSLGVNNGLFMVVLGDTTLANMTAIAPAIFTQPNLQLRIWFNDGVSGFAVLNPAQPLTPTPYAIVAGSASNLLGTVAASQLTGTLPAAQLGGTYSGAVTFANGNDGFNGNFNGNGGGITNLSANSLVTISTNVSIIGWGWNLYGELNIPPNLNQVVAAAAGLAHSLALNADGTVTAWGAGEVNDGSDSFNYGQSIVPAGLSNVVAVSAGYLHSLALEKNGTVVAWGAGLTNDPASGPLYGQSIVPAGLSNVVAIAAGAYNSLALSANGTVVAWGAGLTNNPTDNADFGQSIIPAATSNSTAISAGLAHGVALKGGKVIAWGNNQYGQTNVPAGLTNVIAVAAGGLHTLALKMDGTVVAWGAGTFNNPSDGVNFGQSMVPLGLNNVVAIEAGYLHSVALLKNGRVIAWGAGETNDPSTFGQSGQSIVPAGLDNAIALASGSMALHTLALRPRSSAPVAWLDSDNTFNGSIQVNGGVNISGELTAGGDMRLNDANLWLRGGNDQNNGLGWYGGAKTFANFNGGALGGPVLFGASGGALGSSSTNGTQQVALAWDASQHVGIGTTTPNALLSLGNNFANTKLLVYDDGSAGFGMGATNGEFRFHLGGDGGSFSFLNAPQGTEMFTIAGYGDVGIGTPAPQSRLDVRGQIALGSSGQYFAASGQETLRIIRGVVSSTGAILGGSGFTVTYTGTGSYTLNFTNAFSDVPSVIVTAQSGIMRVATVTSVSANAAPVRTFNSAGTAADNQFNFIAIGAQ